MDYSLLVGLHFRGNSTKEGSNGFYELITNVVQKYLLNGRLITLFLQSIKTVAVWVQVLVLLPIWVFFSIHPGNKFSC